jgi:hypothetical protein
MPSKYMPLKLAREMDDANQDAGETGEDAVDSLDRKKYLQPCLRAKPLAPETWDQGAKPSFEKDEVRRMCKRPAWVACQSRALPMRLWPS